MWFSIYSAITAGPSMEKSNHMKRRQRRRDNLHAILMYSMWGDQRLAMTMWKLHHYRLCMESTTSTSISTKYRAPRPEKESRCKPSSESAMNAPT